VADCLSGCKDRNIFYMQKFFLHNSC
jgi:hypothetical protein